MDTNVALSGSNTGYISKNREERKVYSVFVTVNVNDYYSRLEKINYLMTFVEVRFLSVNPWSCDSGEDSS